MSAIKSIYDAIAAWTPTYDSDVSISAKDVHQIPAVLHSAETPVRLLLVPEGPEAFCEFVGLSKRVTIEWRIIDRLFIKPVAQGEGIEKATEWLVDYMDSYIEAIQADRSPTSQSHIVGAEITAGVFNWPPSPQGVPFFGINVVLTIQEII
jgi:hypothetical protein